MLRMGWLQRRGGKFHCLHMGIWEWDGPLIESSRGRIQASKHSNPKHRYNAADRFNSYAETGVYFQTLMDASKNAVPLDYLKVLFGTLRYSFIVRLTA
jgi:hypothetical protein